MTLITIPALVANIRLGRMCQQTRRQITAPATNIKQTKNPNNYKGTSLLNFDESNTS
jgi:hypothetical protein